MQLESIATENFRNLEAARHSFHPSANVFVGENGQGKTNLLEAIYFLATTKSFRTNQTSSLFRFGAPHLFVEGIVRAGDGTSRNLSTGLSAPPERKREILVNGQRSTLHEYVRQLQVFAYSSARLEIIRGAPEERRRFLDRGIISVQPAYLEQHSRYLRVLKQRNALLEAVRRGESRETALDPWDEEFVQAATVVVEARKEYAERLSESFRRVIERLQYHVTDLELRYEPALEGETAREEFRRRRRAEIRVGHSLAGPHRDVLKFLTRGADASEVLSSGETKMTVLFLKLAKIALFHERFDEQPIFVFDDIDAELDLPIMERLLNTILGTTQLFTSSAKAEIFADLDLGPHRRFRLRTGRIIEASEIG